MINCRSLLYWGVRISLVLPQTPWSSFPELLFFSFTAKLSFFLFFCLQQKPTSYLFLHKRVTSSQPPLPPPCSCTTIATCRTRVSQPCQRISPHFVTQNVSYSPGLAFFYWMLFHRFSEWMCLFHTFGSVCYTVRTHSAQLQTASEFTSVRESRSGHVRVFYLSLWTHFEKALTVVQFVNTKTVFDHLEWWALGE